jgi:hypothetical protein
MTNRSIKQDRIKHRQKNQRIPVNKAVRNQRWANPKVMRMHLDFGRHFLLLLFFLL